MSIKDILNNRFQQAMQSLDIPEDCPPLLTLSGKPQFGDYQANGAMGAAKRLNTNPRDLAQKIIDNLDLDDIAQSVEIAGPGFINITLRHDYLAAAVCSCLDHPEVKPQTVVIDYSAPNLAKEMHVGHLRSTIIGDALARLLEYQGHGVIRQNHMGDWGTQFGMLIAELELQLGEGAQAELALSDLEVFYQQAKKHFDADPSFADTARSYVVKLQSGDTHCRKLWQQFIEVSVAHNLEIYRQLNVSLGAQDIQPESAYNDDLEQVISDLSEQGLAIDSEEAKVEIGRAHV